MAEVIAVVVFSVVICLLLAILVFLWKSGLFYNIEISTGKPPIGKVTVAYKFARGQYKDCGPLFAELSGRLKPRQKCLGIYYDDPKVVPKDKCRYVVCGVIAENGETPEEEQKKRMVHDGYKIFQLPSVSNVVKTNFPFSGQLSIIIAVSRVYPKLSAYVEEKGLHAHPCMEIYDGTTMHFMAPLDKQTEFYVDETQDSVE